MIVNKLKNEPFVDCCDNSDISDYGRLEIAYGTSEHNWGDRDVFQGGYINLGYWDDALLGGTISIEDRIKSARNLYLHILEQLSPTSDDKVLEIGCGRGMGVTDVAQRYNVKKIVGIDALQSQVDRAKERIAKDATLKGRDIELLRAYANVTQQADGSIDKIFSVEIIQHFAKFTPFAKEIRRILKPGGRAVFTAHLSTQEDSVQKMKEEGLLVGEGTIDVFVPIKDVISAFESFDFKPRYYSIGKKVFDGFERWLVQEHQDNKLGLSLCESYKNGYLDYYVIVVDAD